MIEVTIFVIGAIVGYATAKIPHRYKDSDRRQMILTILHQDGEAFGLDIVRAAHGIVTRSNVYIHLEKLFDMGLVKYRNTVSPGGGYRHIYSLTEKGEKLFTGDASDD